MSSKRWKVKEVETDASVADTNESNLILTINSNRCADEDEIIAFKGIIGYMLERLDKILLLKQGNVFSGYADLSEYLVEDVQVEVRYEIGPRFGRSHCHIFLHAKLSDRGSMMNVDITKVREYLIEQWGYNPHVNVKVVDNAVLNLSRYIRK
jgi:hypothetical protein